MCTILDNFSSVSSQALCNEDSSMQCLWGDSYCFSAFQGKRGILYDVISGFQHRTDSHLFQRCSQRKSGMQAKKCKWESPLIPTYLSSLNHRTFSASPETLTAIWCCDRNCLMWKMEAQILLDVWEPMRFVFVCAACKIEFLFTMPDELYVCVLMFIDI